MKRFYFMSGGFAAGTVVGSILCRMFGLETVFMAAGIISFLSLVCFALRHRLDILLFIRKVSVS